MINAAARNPGLTPATTPQSISLVPLLLLKAAILTSLDVHHGKSVKYILLLVHQLDRQVLLERVVRVRSALEALRCTQTPTVAGFLLQSAVIALLCAPLSFCDHSSRVYRRVIRVGAEEPVLLALRNGCLVRAWSRRFRLFFLPQRGD